MTDATKKADSLTPTCTPDEGWCEAREDRTHCNHWWECEPCCSCGHDGGGEADCDCPKHARQRRTMYPHQIARVVHEANRAVQIEQDDESIPVSLSWDDLDPETRQSAIEGVRGVLDGNTPEESHQGWMRFKLAHGWTLGPVKDEAKKEHPLLVAYDELPESQKLKDDLFVAIVRACSGAA